MMRLMPHDQALIVPHSSGAGCVCPGLSVRPMTPCVERVGAIGLDVGVADRRVAPAAGEDLARDRRIARKFAAPRRAGGGGGPPPKFTSRMTGTLPRAFTGVWIVSAISGASRPRPCGPIDRASSRRPLARGGVGLGDAPRHLRRVSGMRP